MTIARAPGDLLLLQRRLEAGKLTDYQIGTQTNPTLVAYLEGTGREYARRPKKEDLVNDFTNHIRTLGYSKSSSSKSAKYTTSGSMKKKQKVAK
jgi:hypothetical protein